MPDDHCLNCGDTIRLINYALGPEWMHVDPYASFPTTGKNTAWRICKAKTVAEPLSSTPERPSGDDRG